MSGTNHTPADLSPYLRDRIEVRCDCWIWIGEIGRTGYGQCQRRPGGRTPGNNTTMAHRAVYHELVGYPGEHLHHWLECDTKCVSPAHLRPMTAPDHAREHHGKTTLDLVAQWRQRVLSGTSPKDIAQETGMASGHLYRLLAAERRAYLGGRSARSGLNYADVERIVERIKAGDESYRAIGADYNVTGNCVRNIARGHTWSAVTGGPVVSRRVPSDAVVLEAFGERKRLLEWVGDPRCVVGEWTLRYRCATGWDHSDAMTQPRGTRVDPPTAYVAPESERED